MLGVSRHIVVVSTWDRLPSCSGLPCTWRAGRSGHITERKATIIARETACLSLADRRTIDAEVSQDATAVEALGDGELTGRVR